MNYAEAPRRCAGLARPGAGIAELELELSESGPWDLAGLQILLVLDRAMRDAGGRMRLAGVPGVLEREAQRAGLAAWLAGVRQC
jgi:ABC-type transporter Mla MlaB component